MASRESLTMNTNPIIDMREEGYFMPRRETSRPVPVKFLSYQTANETELASFEVRIGPTLAAYASFLGETDPQGSDLTERELRSLAAITKRELQNLADLAEVPKGSSPEAIVEALGNRPVWVWFGVADDGGMSILGFADGVTMIMVGQEINKEGKSHE